MRSIPNLNWVSQTEERFSCDGFRLSAEEPILKALYRGLGELPLRMSGIPLSVIQRDTGWEPEGYQLTLSPAGISLESATLRGLHYGLSALKLLLFQGKGTLPAGTAQGRPRFSNRGVFLDVSRGKIPTMDYLEHLVSWMSDLGYNILQLYCEDKLALKKHPLVGSLTGVLTEAQIRSLDELCQSYFIELQPCIQTYSHMHGVLRLPGYSGLAENESLFSLAAGNEGVYDFLEDEFAETLPWFSSRTLNINMDEAYDLGTGFSKEAVESKGKGPVFFEHICRVIEIARRHGAEKILLFGDAVHKYPELMDRLPENVAVIDWNYNAEEQYPSLLEYPPLGREFWAAGGVSTWNSIFPRVYNSYVNLSGYSAEAKQLGADGFLVTDWGDYGHMQPLGLSLYGYLFGAVHTFGPADQTAEIFEKHAWPLIFPDSRVAGAFRALMDSNLAPNIQTGFKTMTIYYFFDDMLDGLAMHGNERYPKISREAFAVLKEKGQQALELLEAAREDAAHWDYPDSHWKALFGEALVSELTLAAKMTCFIAEKGELAYRILERMDDPHCSGDEMLDMICQIRALYQTFQLLREEFVAVWMKRARRIGIETSLSLFDRAGAQMGKTAAWLAEQRRAWLDHGVADVPYTAAEQYRVLWTSDFQNMWDRAYPWQ